MADAVITKNLAESRKLLVEALRSFGIKAYESTTDPRMVYAYTNETEFRLSFMPGNRRTLVSHKVSVAPEHRNKGLGTKMVALREAAAKAAGVTLMLATVMDSSLSQIRVMEKSGWKQLTHNEKTKCSLYGKQLF